MGKERKLRMKDGRILQVASRWNKSQVGRSHCRCFTSWLGLTGEYIERYKMGRQFWSFKKNAKVVKKIFPPGKKATRKMERRYAYSSVEKKGRILKTYQKLQLAWRLNLL